MLPASLPGSTRPWSPPVQAVDLLRPCPDDVLTAYAVAPFVNSIRNEGPELLTAIDW